MKNMKITALILILSTIFSLVGCYDCDEDIFDNKYNATLYDSAKDWVREDFILANPIKTVGFIDENPEGQNPKNRVFIVNDQQRYDEIFVSGIEELQIDFNSQMLIVYTFSDEYVLKRMLIKTEIKNDCLNIAYGLEKLPVKENYGSVCQPYQRWFVVKMDKLDVETVVFEEK